MDVIVHRKVSSEEWVRVVERYEARRGHVRLAAFAGALGLTHHTIQCKVHDERARRAGVLTSKQKSKVRSRNDCCLVPVEVVWPVCSSVRPRYYNRFVKSGT